MTNEKENVGTFRLPELDLLADPKDDTDIAVSRDFLEKRAHRLEDVLAEYGINGKIVNVRPGPVVTLFEFELALDDVVDLADETILPVQWKCLLSVLHPSPLSISKCQTTNARTFV